jgi:hydrogenase nickel incorporation protein HypA/HybF
MHELGIIEEMVQIAEAELDRAGAAGPVSRMTLKVGKLSGASPEALMVAFQTVAPNTRLNGADLVIEEPPARCNCLECGAQSEVDGFVVECPACGSGQIVIDGGRDLLIASLDVAD